MGSEAGASSVGSASTAALDLQALRPGSDEDSGGLEEGRTLQTGLFGVGFTVSKEKAPGWRFASFRLFLDFLQLFLLVVDPSYGYTGFISKDNTGWQIVSFIGLNQFMSDRGYTFFLATMYTLSVLLLCNVGLCIWVGVSFHNNNFNFVWPIVWLRWFGRVFYQVLDIATLTLFLLALDCQYYNKPEGVLDYNKEFPNVACFESPHVYHLTVAAISLVVFIAFAAFFTMTEMELNPLSKNPLSMSHTKVELYGFLLKTVMTVGGIMLADTTHLSILYLVCAAVQTYMYAQWVPHMFAVVNHIRVGCYMSITYCSLLLVAMSFKEKSLVDSGASGDEVLSMQQSITTAMWAGLVPSGLVGAVASYLRLKAFDSLLERFRTASAGTKSRLIYKFTDPREVEILGRCCRHWLPEDDDMLDEEAVQLAESVMKAGLSQLPSSPFMIILYSSFLIDVQTSYQSGYTLLQTAKKKLQDASFLERFAIYSREQMHLQKAAATDPNGQVDLVSFVEFQRAHRSVLKVHKEALMAMRMFWAMLLHSSVKFEALAKGVDKMDTSIKAADRVYKAVLQRHSTSVKIVRLYGKFLEAVKHNPWDAARWFSEADKLEQQEEDAKNTSAFADMNGLDPGLRAALTTMGPLTESRSIIIMNAQCIVQMTNTNVEMFGYQKNELKGKNVNILIPPPFSDHHSTYVRNYLVTGKETVIGRNTEFIALHRERYVLSVTLQVTKVSGIGEDTMFLGVFNTVSAPADVAKAWVLTSGLIISVDPTFTDAFAFKPDDLAGQHLSTIVEARSFARLEEVLKTCKAAAVETSATSAPLTKAQRRASVAAAMQAAPGDPSVRLGQTPKATSPQGYNPESALTAELLQLASSTLVSREWSIKGVKIKHRYSDVVDTDVVISNGGIGAYKFHVLAIKRVPTFASAANVHALEEMFVADRKGRLCHVTKSLASTLGTNPRALIANNAQYAVEALIPAPFNSLHRTLAMSLPLYAPPAYSCRSGLAMLLAAQGPNGPTVSPWRMKMQRREANDDMYHVCQMRHVTMQQAKDERCMTLHVDVASGTISWASDSPHSLFDIHTSSLVGKSIGEVLDVLQLPPQAAEEEEDELGLEKVHHVQTVLMHLSARAISKPDMSYRVGVMASITDADTFLQRHVPIVRTIHPAIMTVSVKQQPNEPVQDPRAMLNGQVADSLLPPPIHLHMRQRQYDDRGGAGDDDVTYFPPGNLVLPVQAAGQWDPETSKPSGTQSTAGDNAANNSDAMVLELQLWRSDLSCSVIELDGSGLVTNNGTDLPLYPPGLMFGAPSTPMPGSHITHYLPQISGHAVSELLDTHTLIGSTVLTLGPEGFMLPGAGGEPKAKARGGLKMSTLTAADLNNRTRVGSIQLMRGRQHADGLEIDLTVQAVYKQPVHGGPSGVYLVLHPYQPKCGRPDFLAFLQQARERETMKASVVPAWGDGSPGSKPLSRARSMNRLGSATAVPGLFGGERSSGGGLLMERASMMSIGGPDMSIRITNPDGSAHMGGFYRTSATRPGLKQAAGLGQAQAPASPMVVWGDAVNGKARLDEDASGSSHLQMEALYAKLGNGVTLPPATARRVMSTDTLERADSGEVQDSARGSINDKPKGVRFNGGGPKDTKESRISMWIQTNGEKYNSADVARVAAEAALATEGSPRMGVVMEDNEPEPSDLPSNDAMGSDERDSDRGSAQGSTHEQDVTRMGEATEQLDEAGTMAPSTQLDTDYRRGQRYKKIARMLAGQAVQRSVQRFRIHALCLVLFLLAVHLGIFVLMVVMILQERDGVQHLQNAGLTVRKAGNLAIYTRYLEVIISKRAAENPVGLWDLQPTPEKFQTMLNLYKAAIDEVQMYASLFFFGDPTPARLPTEYGLRDMWEGNSMVETNVLEIPRSNNTPVGGNVNVSAYTLVREPTYTNLWKMSNKIIDAATTVWRNAPYINETQQDFDAWATVEYLRTNIVGNYTNGIFTTMNAMLQRVETLSSDLNMLQITIAGCEGAILSAFVFVWMWVLSSKVAEQRYLMYNVFMAVPNGLVRGLATKKLDLGDEDEEDDMIDMMGETGQPPAGAMGERRTGPVAGGPDASMTAAGMSTGTFAGKFKIGMRMAPQDADVEAGGGHARKSLWDKFTLAMKTLVATHPPLKVNPGSKRHLKRSIRSTLWLTWPFLAWGIIIIIINIVSFQLLADISAPLKLFNMVNVVASRYKRDVFYAMEVCAALSSERREAQRTILESVMTLVHNDYELMLYGKSPSSNDTTLYRDFPSGLLNVGSWGRDTMFSTKACLAPPNFCHNESSIYYEDTHNGLDRMMRKLFQVFEQIIKMNGTDQPSLLGPEFEYMVNTNFDITYGYVAINSDYRLVVLQVYSDMLNIHVVAFAFTVAVCVFYVVSIYRPFLHRLSSETKRVAELLSMLPSEMDIEGLMQHILIRNLLPPSALVPEKDGEDSGDRPGGAGPATKDRSKM